MATGCRTVAAAAAAAVLAAGLAPPARADEEALRKELDETKAEVRRLLERVERLEGRSAPPGALGEAVEEYLRTHPPGGPGGAPAAGAGNVSAPRSNSLRISGHVLFWWEQWNGSYRPKDPGGDDVNHQGWLRTSLQADAAVTGDLRARVELRDARATGTEPSTTAPSQAPGTGLDLKEGWFEADDLLGSGTRTRAGRQVLAYGDQRLVGDDDWGTYGRSFDGVLLSRLWSRTKVDLFAARVVERGSGTFTPGVDNDDQDFAGIYTSTPRALHHSDLDVYLLLLHDGLSMAGEEAGHAGNTTVWTGGFRLAGVKGAVDWGTEWALQRGRAAGDGLSAWAGHARAGYTLTESRWTPRFGLEWDAATGDEDPTDGDAGAFRTLFPTNHDHYGILDLKDWRNVQAFRASVAVRPAREWTFQADWWRLYQDEAADSWTAAGGGVIRPGAAGASRYLGSEIDLVATWRPSDHVRVSAGASQFFDGGFVGDTGGGGDTVWFYVRVQVLF